MVAGFNDRPVSFPEVLWQRPLQWVYVEYELSQKLLE